MTATPLQRSDELRLETISIMEDMPGKASEYELPAPPDGIVNSLNKLRENRYTVLVVGETRRGKSSFINALIGRDILPVDVDVATCQSFRIRQTDEEGYRLRFLDGSTQTISLEDLPTFGSQVMADAGETPRLDQIIESIEVEVPVRFLPPGIDLLDTPGLGSLYAAHAQITQRFIPQADAVIYTLDSTQPIGQLDIETVKVILETTANIFFIQTKIDATNPEAWKDLQQRNETILRKEFKDRLADSRVWPISSKNLMKAVETDDENYLIVARHRELAAALKQFLVRVAGILRIGETLTMINHHHIDGRKLLSARYASLTHPNQADDDRLSRLQVLKKEWTEDWGDGGKKRKELSQMLQKEYHITREGFRQIFGQGGDIYKSSQKILNSINSARKENVERIAQNISENAAFLAHQKWSETYRGMQEHFVQKVAPFFEEANQVIREATDILAAGVDVHEQFNTQVRSDTFDKASRAVMDMTRASTMVGLVGGVSAGVAALALSEATLVTITMSAAFPPVAAVVVLGAGAWIIARGIAGWFRAESQQIDAAKRDLEKYANETRLALQKYYFDVDPQEGRQSMVDEALGSVLSNVLESVTQLAEQRAREIDADITRVKEESKLNQQQRAAQAKEMRARVTAWDALGGRIQTTMNALVALQKDLEQSAEPQPAPAGAA